MPLRADAVLEGIETLKKVVGEVVGVYDSPDWLIAEILGDLAGWDEVDEDVLRRAVELNSSKLHDVFRRNLQLYRPGRSSIRKAAPYLVAELLEAEGLEPAFIKLNGAICPPPTGDVTSTPRWCLWWRPRGLCSAGCRLWPDIQAPTWWPPRPTECPASGSRSGGPEAAVLLRRG